MGAGIEIPVGVKTGAFRQGLASMKHELDAFKTAATKGNPLANLGAKLGGFIAIGSIISGIQRLVSYGAEIQHLADRFRLTAEQVQRLSHAADIAGTDVGTVAKVISHLTVAANQAAHGDLELSAAFETLNINAAKFRDMSPEDQLVALADAYQKANGNGAQTAAIMELLGRKGQGLLPMLTQGSEAIRKTMDETSVFADDSVAALARIEEAYKSLRNNAVTSLDFIVKALRSLKQVAVFVGMGGGYENYDKMAESLERIWHPKTPEKKEKGLLGELEDEVEGNTKKERTHHLSPIQRMRELAQKRAVAEEEINRLNDRENAARAAREKTTDPKEREAFGLVIGKIINRRNERRADIEDYNEEMRKTGREFMKRDGGTLYASQLASVGGGGNVALGLPRVETVWFEMRNYLKTLVEQNGARDTTPSTHPTPAFSGSLQNSHGLSSGHLQTGKLGVRRR